MPSRKLNSKFPFAAPYFKIYGGFGAEPFFKVYVFFFENGGVIVSVLMVADKQNL